MLYSFVYDIEARVACLVMSGGVGVVPNVTTCMLFLDMVSPRMTSKVLCPTSDV